MRQVGYLAAAGLYALDHHIDRLADDHEKAKQLAEALQNKNWVKKVEPTETNIIIFEINEKHFTESQFLNKLKENQIDIIGMGQGKLRMVTHLDYTYDMHKRVLGILKRL